MSGFRLASLRRLRGLEARAAARALGAALGDEAEAAREVARRLCAAAAVARGTGAVGGRFQPLSAAQLAGAAACAERHAAGLLEAQAVARAAADAVVERRAGLLGARAADQLLERLEARWREGRRRARDRGLEAAADDQGRPEAHRGGRGG